jgi:4-amino-4-deoxy-L-arabinose transferase-like glycosyltransferase
LSYLRTSLDKLSAALRGMTPNTQALVALIGFLALFTVQATLMHLKLPVVAVVYSVCLFALVALLMARARFDGGTIVIVLGGLWLYLGYLGYTDYGERNYDGGEQLRYVQWIIEHHSRPPASQCLICHHPPLYYALGALFYVFFEKTHLGPPITGVQLYSLGCHLIFIGYAAATARRLLATKRELHLATALVVFWPYSIENTVRLHNDTLATTCMGVATYYVVRWAQEERGADLYMAALVTGLGLLTKSSAYVIAGAMFALLFLRFWRSRDKLRYVRRAFVAAAILAIALVLNARGKDSPTSKNAPLCHKILGNACDIHQGQWVENKPKNYVILDLKTFLAEPYALAERDGSGRAYFWNHLLKSSLFGTHNTTPDRETAYEFNRAIAYAMNVLLLGMLAYMAVCSAAFARRKAWKRFGPALLILVSCVAFMMAFRAIIPAPHHTDYRHIASTVVIVSVFYAGAAGRARLTRPWLERVGRMIAVPFIALSIVYFVPKHDLVIRLTTHVVKRDLSLYSKVVAEGTQWDLPTNLLIEENHIVEFDTPKLPTVREIDVSLDNNDRYQIELFGDTRRTIALGPKADKKGLVRYVEKIDPPVANVRTIRIRPLSGDLSYSMGHLITR